MDYIISFSSDKITLDDMDLEKAKEKNKASHRDNLVVAKTNLSELSEDYFDKWVETTVSKREEEKLILKMLIQNKLDTTKDIGCLNELIDLAAQIKNAGASVVLTGEDLKAIRESFTALKNKPARLFKFGDLFKQLQNPKLRGGAKPPAKNRK